MASRIDHKIYNSPATKGEIASVAISASLGIRTALICLYALKQGQELDSAQLDDMSKIADDLSNKFNELTGWVDE